MDRSDPEHVTDSHEKGDSLHINLADVDSDLEGMSVSITLHKTGEPGSGYHTRNDPSAPYQRETVTERRGIIEIRCLSREVIHGVLSADTAENATLLVYDLHLNTTRRSRRIVSATLELEFASTVPTTSAPQVHAIAPAGRVTLLQSTQEESLSLGTQLTARASELGIEVGGSLKWEKTVSGTVSDNARVTGHIFSDDYGKGVGASWVLHENKSIKSGVPSFLRCAILLTRGVDDSVFQCKVKIKAEADWKSEMGRLFGSTPPDDPVLFDPGRPPTNKLRKAGYDADNLGSLGLDDFVEIMFDKSLDKKQDTE